MTWTSSRLYVSARTERWEIGNLDEFFQTKSAPALSDGDGIRLGVKSDPLAWLEDFSQPKSEVPPTSCIVLDGAVVIQLLKPAAEKASTTMHSRSLCTTYSQNFITPRYWTWCGTATLQTR